MTIKRTTLILTLAATALGAMTATASAQPIAQPRKHEVIARAEHQRHEIRAELKRGEIGPMKAHRLLAADRHIAREARLHGGRLSKVEQHRLNRQENRVHRHLES